jgi:hypothetical protein
LTVLEGATLNVGVVGHKMIPWLGQGTSDGSGCCLRETFLVCYSLQVAM